MVKLVSGTAVAGRRKPPVQRTVLIEDRPGRLKLSNDVAKLPGPPGVGSLMESQTAMRPETGNGAGWLNRIVLGVGKGMPRNMLAPPPGVQPGMVAGAKAVWAFWKYSSHPRNSASSWRSRFLVRFVL